MSDPYGVGASRRGEAWLIMGWMDAHPEEDGPEYHDKRQRLLELSDIDSVVAQDVYDYGLPAGDALPKERSR